MESRSGGDQSPDFFSDTILPKKTRQIFRKYLLTFRRWKEELECAEFWRWADIEVTDDNLEDVTKSNRILVVDSISLDKSLSDLSANIFLNFLINCEETLAARSLSLEELNLSTIDVETLSSVLVRLEEIDLTETQLTMNQVNAIFHKLASSDASSDARKLKVLDLDDNVLSSVSPHILSAVLVSMKKVGMSGAELTKDQLEAFLTRITQTEDLGLKILDLSFIKILPAVRSSILSSAIIKVESVNLSWTDLTQHQLSRLFSQIVETEAAELSLQELDVFGNNLSSMEPESLARALLRLEKVNLYGLGLTAAQVTAIITGIAHSQTAKHPAHFSFAGFDFSLVSMAVLAEAVVRLEDVNLSIAQNVDKHQVSAVMNNIASCQDLYLEVLDISGLDLSSVSPASLAQTVVRLKQLVCSSVGRLSPDQTKALFCQLVESEDEDLRLEMLVLEDNDLSAVPAELMSSGIVRLKKVSLTGASLEPGSLEAIFSKIVETEEIQLEELLLLGQDCQLLSPEYIQRAHQRLTNLQLDHRWLPGNEDSTDSNTPSCSCSIT